MSGVHSMPRALAVGLTIVALSVVIVFTAASRPARSDQADHHAVGKTVAREGND